ncbi:MAG TPA: prepilin-type N-terminal cleavage/methylation domain-containing protein [Acidobacteriota bacterium]|jgi:prepilin-type N-terminal cleavage/methylation domain-containing protein
MKSQRGFTLVELLISVTILAVISSGIFTLIVKNQQRYSAEEDYAVAVQNARAALDLVGRYVRQAGNNPQRAAFVPFSFDNSTLTIRSDLTGSRGGGGLDSTGDPDGLLTASYETITIRYDRNAKQLLLNVGLGEDVIANNVDDFQVSFADNAGAVTADMNNVYSITITLKALSSKNDPQTGKPNGITLSTSVFVRAKSYTPYS